MTDPADPNKAVRDNARFASLGLQFGLTFLIFCGLGYALDRWLETAPFGLLGGVLLGGVGASINLWRGTFPAKDGQDASKKNSNAT